MHDHRTHQPFTYDVRLPDESQADALRQPSSELMKGHQCE